MNKKILKSLTPEKKAKIINNAAASLAIEGLYVTEKEKSIIRGYLDGHYTEKEALKMIGSLWYSF